MMVDAPSNERGLPADPRATDIEKLIEFLERAGMEVVEEYARSMFESNPGRNQALHWANAATPRERYRKRVRASLSSGAKVLRSYLSQPASSEVPNAPPPSASTKDSSNV